MLKTQRRPPDDDRGPVLTNECRSGRCQTGQSAIFAGSSPSAVARSMTRRHLSSQLAELRDVSFDHVLGHPETTELALDLCHGLGRPGVDHGPHIHSPMAQTDPADPYLGHCGETPTPFAAPTRGAGPKAPLEAKGRPEPSPPKQRLTPEAATRLARASRTGDDRGRLWPAGGARACLKDCGAVLCQGTGKAMIAKTWKLGLRSWWRAYRERSRRLNAVKELYRHPHR
jgi:hypothetical protein